MSAKSLINVGYSRDINTPMHDRPKILIVDDLAANLVSLRRVLARVDAEIYEADCGDRALALSLAHDFALAILDVQMPDMDGYELAEILRGEARTRTLPIIFISAVFTEEAHVFRGYDAGAVDFLPKPIEPEWLLSKVEVFLELFRQKSHFKNRLAISEAIQDVLIHISVELNRTPTRDLENAVCTSLAVLGRYCAADRVHLCLCDPDGTIHYLREWAVDGLPANCGIGDRGVGTAMPWYVEQLLVGRAVYIADTKEPSTEAAADLDQLMSRGVRSCIMLPVSRAEQPAGFLGLEWVREITPMPRFVVPLLQVAGNMLYGALGRMWSEAAVVESQERQQLAIQGADLGTWDWDAQTDRVAYSDRWAHMLGYTLDELEPTLNTWENRIHPDDLTKTLAALQEHVDGHTDSYESEHRLRSKSGEWVWVLDRGRVLARDESGAPMRICGTHMDITQHKRAEEARTQAELQLQQIQKMESIGQLAGGVAHDFNNHLSVILGASELLLSDPSLRPDQREKVELVIGASERSSRLTRQLLMFCRKQAILPRPLDCNEQIRSSLKLYNRIIGEDIRLIFNETANLPMIFADEQQMDQVLANLLINARDAIHAVETQGREKCITIQTSITNAPPEVLGSNKSRAESYISVEVTDTGCGMTPEIQRRIFEPFFTTKPEGCGTGLGLSTVFGVMRQNNGVINVTSTPDVGTTFTLYWPALASCVNTIMFEDTPSSPRPWADGGHELILFVEDEFDLRTLAVQFLRQKGYRVIEAATGDQALAILTDGAFSPDLLISDVVMPGMNGIELAAAARSIKPDIEVLMVSGYTDDILSRFAFDGTAMELLDKPYGIEVLLKRVEDLLSSRRPTTQFGT